MKQPKYKLVIAGNYRQFKEWCRENQTHPMDRYVRHIGAPYHLRGYTLDEAEVIWYGTYYDRPDLPDLQQEVHIMEARSG